jgi:predicted PhzF superfamily epimerase YddE/YHI9
MTATAKIRCMHDRAERAGGLADVVWLGVMDHAAALEASAGWLADHPVRSCVTVFIAADAGRYSVESFSVAQHRIRFCGHGALAAAFCILEQHPDAGTLVFYNEWRSWEAELRAGADYNIKLRFPRPQVAPADVPDFAFGCLGRHPVRAAFAGGADDYLILELESEADVARLKPDPDLLSTATRRALIVTARAADGIVYRYFAPQYGESEDAATGSAAVQLAAYWQPHIAAGPFLARQLSSAGALVELAVAGDQVELAARVGYA